MSGSYSREAADKILAEISAGKSLRTVCKENPELPPESTVRMWRANNTDGFDTRMTAARRNQADSGFDDLWDLVDDVRNGDVDPNKARVMADIKKWAIAKLHHAAYGDKLDVNTTNPLAEKSENELRAAAAELLARAVGAAAGASEAGRAGAAGSDPGGAGATAQ